jgi:cbb3-type cytochrome oxidase subunit 3
MTLSDVMGNSGLSRFAIVAMVIFIVTFVAIVIALFRPGRRAEMERDARLPLDDELEATPHQGGIE